MAQVPVEIFGIITSYLTRAEVRNLRLVCRDFEVKVSAQYFCNVVVPFRAELYGALSRDEHGSLRHSSSRLLSNGMHMFESFGPHIRRFALSLELDEDSLAYPPIKPIQEAVPAFWGIYRWPHENYYRYADLEGLEQTADETEGMKAALRCLTRVQNIGLCCDAGLGFLLGPDKRAQSSHKHHPVFATVDWRLHQRSAQSAHRPSITVADFNDVARNKHESIFSNPKALRITMLERMAKDVGYSGQEVSEAVRIMLATENVNLANFNSDEGSASPASNLRPDGLVGHLLPFDSPKDAVDSPLVPTSLTKAQKEMLLELEWAHRAMIQSYVLGLIDNASAGCFEHLTTITIAKIPGSHVHLLCRNDLWGAISSLKNVSIGVIADWRKVTVSSPGVIDDSSISPVESVSQVFTLLSAHVGKRRNVESIHFEWICGGEFAPSWFQRNSYILPVPFVKHSNEMITPTAVRDETSSLLQLPHVKHLSLKNCWSSPHVFLQTIRQFALSSLESLELESVSLSGPPTTVAQATLHQETAAVANQAVVALMEEDDPDVDTTQDGSVPELIVPPLPPQNFPIYPPSDDAQDLSVNRLQQPDLFTWAGLVDHFSPNIKLRQLLAGQSDPNTLSTALAERVRAVYQYIPHTADLRGDEYRYCLRCISFRSCGYVSVDAPYLNTRAVLPESLYGHGIIHSAESEISNQMQTCKDQLLAKTTQYMTLQEQGILTNGFGMSMGWAGVYDKQLINDAMLDGVKSPGLGRFSGLIESRNRSLRHQDAPVTA
ncbi:hypothetical protein ED733_004871 [Metarhizium rileyi]|uniref:F-box domain-containing protein n=1 Tax=Metarhizium rileyi (strain RCEF 4871) TaxID=1649241 RepID=A0A5C6GD33_METRR|nr:hypothetical protein ED733_004871 [Metarhizium rileyi]